MQRKKRAPTPKEIRRATKLAMKKLEKKMRRTGGAPPTTPTTPGKLDSEGRALALGDWKPKDSYHLVDLGCGKGDRLRAMAKAHPEKHFLGFDPRLEGNVKAGNLELLRGRAQDVLPRLPDTSIRLANMDYFLTDIPEEQAGQVLQLLRPKLRRNARVYISHRNEAERELKSLVSRSGFEPSKSRSIEELKLPMTPATEFELKTQKNIEGFRRGKPSSLPIELTRTGRIFHVMHKPEAYAPMRFVARVKR
ncbi:MAG: hypothetical protein JXB14_05445 [Candidatus Altiarchaeota archaeon]|nr:hypothetical protein [Candidatus Altiarchaeota archaeon]